MLNFNHMIEAFCHKAQIIFYNSKFKKKKCKNWKRNKKLLSPYICKNSRTGTKVLAFIYGPILCFISGSNSLNIFYPNFHSCTMKYPSLLLFVLMCLNNELL